MTVRCRDCGREFSYEWQGITRRRCPKCVPKRAAKITPSQRRWREEMAMRYGIPPV